MEPCLVVIGLNFRTAPAEVRERFWIAPERRRDALAQLARMDGVEEAMVLATCGRTEFLLWASDFSAAAGSVLAFLTREYGLRLDDWKHFYRLLCDESMRHCFRMAAGLDSIVTAPRIALHLQKAWMEALEAQTGGRMLQLILHNVLEVAQRVRQETAFGALSFSIPSAAVTLGKEMLGSLEGRRVVILGAGEMAQLCARHLGEAGTARVTLANRTYERARELAARLGCEAVPLEDRCPSLVEADLVIACTACPHVILSRGEAERIAQQRGGRPLFFLDLAMPRNLDPDVGQVPGAFLYGLDDLERVVARQQAEHHTAAAEAEALVATAAHAFSREVASERVIPTIAALRECLDEVRRQEVERYTRDFGPLTPAQELAIEALSNRIVQRIAGSLARELREMPQAAEQDKMTSAVQRLFHLERTRAALAGHRQ